MNGTLIKSDYSLEMNKIKLCDNTRVLCYTNLNNMFKRYHSERKNSSKASCFFSKDELKAFLQTNKICTPDVIEAAITDLSKMFKNDITRINYFVIIQN